jgi:sortase (surface protein transpeptidase)
MIEDTKVVINSRTSKKDRQYNDQKKKDRQYNDQKKKDRQYNDQKKKHKTIICPSLDRKLNIYNQS